MSITAKPVQVQNFSLSGAGSAIGDTSLNLKSFKDITGTNLTMTSFGSIGYGTIEPGNGTQEEQISFSGITQNADGTAVLTGVKHVLFIPPYTESSGMTITHPGSVVFIISNTSAYENAIYTYINTAIASGGVPATSSVQGITTLSIDPAVAGTPVAVGANNTKSGTAISVSNNVIDDAYVPTLLPTVNVSHGTGDVAKFPILNSAGILDTSFVPLEFSPSSNLKASSDAEVNTTSLSYTKVKEIQVFKRGTITVKFDGNTSATNNAGYGRVYINGSAVGTQQSLPTSRSSYPTFTENFNVKPQDLIQLYIQENEAVGTTYAKNFRLYWDLVAATDYVVNT